MMTNFSVPVTETYIIIKKIISIYPHRKYNVKEIEPFTRKKVISDITLKTVSSIKTLEYLFILHKRIIILIV